MAHEKQSHQSVKILNIQSPVRNLAFVIYAFISSVLPLLQSGNNYFIDTQNNIDKALALLSNLIPTTSNNAETTILNLINQAIAIYDIVYEKIDVSLSRMTLLMKNSIKQYKTINACAPYTIEIKNILDKLFNISDDGESAYRTLQFTKQSVKHAYDSLKSADTSPISNEKIANAFNNIILANNNIKLAAYKLRAVKDELVYLIYEE